MCIRDSYNYAWTVPTGVTDPGNVASFTTTVAGSYSVVITHKTAGCVSPSASATVSFTAAPSVTVSAPSVCAGAPATVTATPGSGVASDYDYAWTVPTGAPAPGNVSTFTTTVAGSYSVVITHKTAGCVSPSASATVSFTGAATVTK